MNGGVGKMFKKINVVWQYGQEISEYKAFLICDGLAITIIGENNAILERVSPSANFPGRYEPAGDESEEFSISDEILEILEQHAEEAL
jgi:hypothetical protein